ncbi:MAG: hypothetical protein LBD16_02430 [Oscillospiraceae bacterium]|jgi:CRISPR/Cas system-associated protein Cas10 (large subunit of type III CRISPR-Cas system)|nr:hypothetical protein [Oscillospiraceae bacterium]
MALVKCPRCELNYILDGEKYCTVCRREIKGEPEREAIDICPVCNENPVMHGRELCAMCLKEMGQTQEAIEDDGDEAAENADVDAGSLSGMDEITLDTAGDIPRSELGEIDRELSLDEALAEEEQGDDEEEEE